jgi:hypothetical protein
MPLARIAGARRAGLLACGIALLTTLAASGLTVGPSAARGASTIPDEPGAFLIDRPSYAALVADVDGDGIGELIRITNAGIDRSRLVVEVWRQAVDGTWSTDGPAVPLRRARSPADRVTGVPADRDGMVPVLADGRVRLLLWRQGGRPHVLVVVNADSGIDERGPCCLTVWELTDPPSGVGPSLTLLIDTQRGGDSVFAVDMDGDGTEELAVRDVPAGSALGSFSVLRWSGGRFTVISRPLNAGDEAQPYLLGNSDGLPGDEVGLIGSFGSGTAYGLTRVSLLAGAIESETTDIPGTAPGVVMPLMAGADAASLILFGEGDQVLRTYSWPAGKELTEVARSSRRGRPLGVIGSGSTLRILLGREASAALDLIGPDLSEGSVQSVVAADAAKPFFDKTYTPYVGPWPDFQPAGSDAQVFGGKLIRAQPGLAPQLSPMAALPAMAPLGELGRDGAWTALAQRTAPAPRVAEMARRGGELLQNDEFTITFARTDDVLSPEVGGGAIHPAVEDAILDASATTAQGEGLLIGTPVFAASVVAPPGSLAIAANGRFGEVSRLAKTPSADQEIAGPPFRVPIGSSAGSSGNQAFAAALHIITPAGHAYTARWHVRLLRTPPKLRAEAPFLSLGFRATIHGQTDPTAIVTADGQSTHAGRDGRFELNVPAGFVPRDVRLQARDPIGNVANVSVNVVAPLDYRRLPWTPIIFLLTLGAGAILFLRAPRLVGRPAASRVDEGTLEEIDAD